MEFNGEIKILQRKLYQYKRNFNNFDDIDEKKGEELKKRFFYVSMDAIDTGVYSYLYYLNAIINNTSFHLLNYDERIYLFINFVDPELIIFKEYLGTNILPPKEFEDSQKQTKYNNERKKQIVSFQSKVRQELGFFDENLIEYEIKYFKKFYSNNLLKNVNKDYSSTFLKFGQFITSFSTITKERLAEIELIADEWLKVQQNNNNYTTSAFNISFQSNLLNLNNIYEQLIFFILVNDRSLKALAIHEEESLISREKSRCLKELGFYDPNFIQIEQIYHDTFYPDLEVSPFTMIKNDKR